MMNSTNDTLMLINNLTLFATDQQANPAKTWVPIVVPIFFAILLISGLVGNLFIIYIILRHKYMQITPNLYIMNLAIGDLLLLIFSAPFTALTYVLDTYPFGTLLCKIDQTSQNLTLGVTIFTLMALSYDRCSSIRDPIVCHTNKSNRTKRSQIGIILIWTLAILFCIPDGINTTILSYPTAGVSVNNTTQAVFKLDDVIEITKLNTHVIDNESYNSIIRNFTYFQQQQSQQHQNENSQHLIQVCYPYYILDIETPSDYTKIRVIVRFFVYFFVPILIIGTFYIIIAVVLLRPFKYLNTVDNLIETIEQEDKKKNLNKKEINKKNVIVSLNGPPIQQQQQHQQQQQKRPLQRSFKKSKNFSIYSSVYDNTTNSEATDILELKNLNHSNKQQQQQQQAHTRKLNSVSSMRSSTANYIVNRRHVKARLKIVKMVLFLVIIFIVLCLPEHIYYFLWNFTKIQFNHGLLILRILSRCGIYAHASIHAYVLFCLSSKFRYYGHNLLLKCNRRILSSSKQNSSSPQRPHKPVINNHVNHKQLEHIHENKHSV